MDEQRPPRRERRAQAAKLQASLPRGLRRTYKAVIQSRRKSYELGASSATALECDGAVDRLGAAIAENKAREAAEAARLAANTPPTWLAWMMMWCGMALRRKAGNAV